MNKKYCEILKEVINNKYSNIRLDNMYYDDNEFYYEFKSDDIVSENDFNDIEKEINKLDNNIYFKLIRISGVYYNGDSNNDKPSNYLFNKEKNNTNASEENQMDKNEEEKNSKYNDTNFWQTNTESLVNEKEMQNLIDDL